MADLDSAMEFAALRLRAERNVETHIASVLSSLADDIAAASRGIMVVSSESVFSRMVRARAEEAINDAETQINDLIRNYAKASINALSDKDTGATGRLLASELFGKTFTERSRLYLSYFFNDIIKILYAGRKEKMRQADIEAAVKSQFKNPYGVGLIDRANQNGARISVPSYGRGIYRSAYSNIIRNAQGTVAIAWGREARNFARRNGAVGFRIHRGSSFPCPICEEAAATFHSINETPPPLHARCVCYTEFIYPDNDNNAQ